jgi:hypothetical protein
MFCLIIEINLSIVQAILNIIGYCYFEEISKKDYSPICFQLNLRKMAKIIAHQRTI